MKSYIKTYEKYNIKPSLETQDVVYESDSQSEAQSGHQVLPVLYISYFWMFHCMSEHINCPVNSPEK